MSRYNKGDIVAFKFSNLCKETFNGVIISSRKAGRFYRTVYEIASMNHNMCSYSIGEALIVKKIE